MNRCEHCGATGPDEWLHHTVDTDGEHWWCERCCPCEPTATPLDPEEERRKLRRARAEQREGVA